MISRIIGDYSIITDNSWLDSPVQRLGPPASTWSCRTLAEKLLAGLEGDIRVEDSTIIVTYYNAPQADRLQQIYAELPAKLAAENIDPRIPWLYDFKLDFRFR